MPDPTVVEDVAMVASGGTARILSFALPTPITSTPPAVSMCKGEDVCSTQGRWEQPKWSTDFDDANIDFDDANLVDITGADFWLQFSAAAATDADINDSSINDDISVTPITSDRLGKTHNILATFVPKDGVTLTDICVVEFTVVC